MRLLPIVLSALITVAAYGQQQQILLLTEDFEAPSVTFAFDTGGLGTPTGNNRWIINNEYDGDSIYPNTLRQDSTVTGTIGNAPYSTYLHIHDVITAANDTVANANYDPKSPSSRFAYTGLGFCTLGMTQVNLAFFYLCEGSANAYGEIYYSVDGGTWQQTGVPRYSNQSKWKYATFSDSAWANVSNLRIGFRWVNDAGLPPYHASFAIDDIIVVGTYPNGGTRITVDNLFPVPVCRQSALFFEWHMSQPMCDGIYRVELSNKTGSFGSRTNLGAFYIFNPDTAGFVGVVIPRSAAAGTCYKVRLYRTSPPPVVVGEASVCFEVQTCPNIITTMDPVIFNDPTIVCSQSTIDVQFTSTRVYNNNNVYIAQLSDSAGNFEYYDTTTQPIDSIIFNPDSIFTPVTEIVYDTVILPPDSLNPLPDTVITPIDTVVLYYDTTVNFIPDTITIGYDTLINVTPAWYQIGTLPSSETFDPAIGAMPGTVSGLVPKVPEGCNYYIRVVSTSPVAEGSVVGPFCIRHCDITTNETVNIQACITDTSGVTDTVIIDIHSWDTTAHYQPGNKFQVQLLDTKFFTVVNTGALGAIVGDDSTTLLLIIPDKNALAALGISPGDYYMRIISDSSSQAWNVNGTLIHLTIGAPSVFLIVTPDDSIYCTSEFPQLYISPYNPESEYEWSSPQFNNGIPFKWPFNPLRINLAGPPEAALGPYFLEVREINYGCVGPYSTPGEFFVTTIPDVNIVGPSPVCEGDTFLYSVGFRPKTYYTWELSSGIITDTSNNEVILTFDSIGAATLSVDALNICGQRASTKVIDVVQVLTVDAGEDTTICRGKSIMLEAAEAALKHTLSTTFTGNQRVDGCMFNLYASADITITGFSANIPPATSVDVEIYYRPSSYIGFETDPSSWTLAGSVTGIVPNTGNPVIFIPINLNIPMPFGSTYGFYITTTNNTDMRCTNGTAVNTQFRTDGMLSFYQGSSLNYPFSSPAVPKIWNGIIHYNTEVGVDFLWSTGDSTKGTIISPDETRDYTIEVSDSNGCGNSDSITVFVNPLPEVKAGFDDTIMCKGEAVQLNASGADEYQWAPGTGLSNPNISNPTAQPADSVAYIVQGTDTATGCANYATVKVKVDGCELTLTIPQAFTPNGDGVNNFFTVFGDNIDHYEIRIFNRWGEQVYFSSSVNDLSQGDTNKGWNGTYKGKPQDTGVYVYYIKASKEGGTPVERKGNVTLIR